MSNIETAERRSKTDRRGRTEGQLASQLLAAMALDEIEILFQPQFAADDGRLVGAEALARWRHPDRGEVGADELLAMAARGGIVAQLTHHIVRTALGLAGNWPVPLRLALNVTAQDFAAGGLARNIADAVDEAGFPPEHLTIEITEQVMLTDLDRAAEQLRELSDLGVRVALDDFGAGFCNFHYLKHLPIDALKLDRRMIEGITDDPRDLEVLRGIMAMARALGLDVVAEGIEREEQREIVIREGCTTWQGYLASRPLSAAAFAQMCGRAAYATN